MGEPETYIVGEAFSFYFLQLVLFLCEAIALSQNALYS